MIEVREYLEGRVADDRFPLIRYLGGTKHSAVFLTECAESGDQRTVIKLIPAPPGNSEAQLTRWRLASKFSHPHLLRLFQMGRCTLDDSPMLYVVMEYAEENLAEILSERPLSPAETSEMLGPVLEALGYLHSKGFVHAHIQPSNIMAIGDQVKLSSDGICRIGEFAERKNGQSRYSAPECVTGALSPASDVWSLGMTLVECLTEHLPKIEEGSREEVSLPAELPAPFLEVARHCLSRAPLHRWNVSDLKAHLQRKPVASEEVAAPARREAPSRQRYTLALPALGLSAALIVLGIVLIGHTSKTKGAHPTRIESSAGQSSLTPVRAKKSPAAQPPRSNSGGSEGSNVHEVVPPVPPASHSAAPGSVEQGGVVHRVLPAITQNVRETIWGTVRVRVRVNVDPSGRVAAAKFDSAGPSPYFAGLSMRSARQWKFQPAAINGKASPSEWLIRFDYTRSETTAAAVEENP